MTIGQNTDKLKGSTDGKSRHIYEECLSEDKEYRRPCHKDKPKW